MRAAATGAGQAHRKAATMGLCRRHAGEAVKSAAVDHADPGGDRLKLWRPRLSARLLSASVEALRGFDDFLRARR